jgi:hypothetical protein
MAVYLLGFYHSRLQTPQERKEEVLCAGFVAPGLSYEDMHFETPQTHEIWATTNFKNLNEYTVSTSGFTVEYSAGSALGTLERPNIRGGMRSKRCGLLSETFGSLGLNGDSAAGIGCRHCRCCLRPTCRSLLRIRVDTSKMAQQATEAGDTR